MGTRTFAIGDIHGELEALFRIMGALPELGSSDTLVFVGDYVDVGPKSAQVVEYLRSLATQTAARVVTLRGNHEDGWLRVLDQGGWPSFTTPPTNGCLATLRSFAGGPAPAMGDDPRDDEIVAMHAGSFFPPDVVEWLRALPFYFEDEHAIYVHAGLVEGPNGFMHPSEVKAPVAMLWCRDMDFFTGYRGKLVVFGHTKTEYLPPELSSYTPEDPTDIWAGPCTVGLDTGCGRGGYLTALELPAMRVYESR